MRARSDRKPRLVLRMIVMLIAVGVLLGLVWGWHFMQAKMMKQYFATMKEPPQTVSTMRAEYAAWQPKLEAIGTLRAVKGADLALDLSGVVATVDVKSGDDVKAGQLLLTLRDNDGLAALRQLQANAALAKVTYERFEKQLAVKAVARADYDARAADLKAKQAAVAQQQALVAKKELHAPFDGHAGIITVNPGDYLNAGTTIVTVQQLDPIFVDFNVPQKDLGSLKVGQKVAVSLDAFPGRPFEGQLTAINPKVDTSTRNVLVEARIANGDRVLMPGMFVKVAVDIGSTVRQLTLPQTAVSYNPYGSTVFVAAPAKAEAGNAAKPANGAKGAPAAPELVAKQVFVTTGPTRGDQVAILTGIKEGDEVVTSGQLKLKNDTPLVVNNTVQPANNPAPTPQEH